MLRHGASRNPLPSGRGGGQITAMKLQGYIKWRRREGDADATIRRQLGRLRSAFNRAKALDFIKVGQFKPSSVTQIAEKSDAR